MGNERFKHLLKTKEGRAAFTPRLFAPERFLDFREGDTNILPTLDPKHQRHYAVAEQRFRSGDVRCVGDKVRAFPPTVSTIIEHFPSPRFVFIYRDLLQVASSFEVRAANPQDIWPTSSDYQHALKRWQVAFASATAAMERGGDECTLLVKYERLFNFDRRTCDALFGFLGLDVSPSVRDEFQQMTAGWEDRRTKELVLSDEQREFLVQRRDQAVVDRFDARFEQQLVRYGGD
jgi:hypothetical protein